MPPPPSKLARFPAEAFALRFDDHEPGGPIDRHRIDLGVVGSLDHAGVGEFDVAERNRLPAGRDLFDGNRVLLDAQPFGIDPRLAGLDVKLPAVPWTADDLAAPQILVSAWDIGRHK